MIIILVILANRVTTTATNNNDYIFKTFVFKLLTHRRLVGKVKLVPVEQIEEEETSRKEDTRDLVTLTDRVDAFEMRSLRHLALVVRIADHAFPEVKQKCSPSLSIVATAAACVAIVFVVHGRSTAVRQRSAIVRVAAHGRFFLVFQIISMMYEITVANLIEEGELNERMRDKKIFKINQNLFND